jgi:hypothetical protein
MSRVPVTVGFEAFQCLRHQFALQYSVLDKDHKTNEKGGTPGPSSPGMGSSTACSSTLRSHSGTLLAKDLNKERDELMVADKCFYCKVERHVEVQCPNLLAVVIREMQAQ